MMNVKKILTLAAIFVMFSFIGNTQTATKLTPIQELGKKLFFDTNLSTPAGQSCAACHAPQTGWTGPLSADKNPGHAVYEGAVKGRFGNRKPPSAAYAGDSPNLHQDEKGDFVGGMFWDGRATGAILNDPLAEQAGGPFLNPLEQNSTDKKTVVMKVKSSDYAPLFEQVWNIKKEDWEKNADKIYEDMARSIAAFEESEEVSSFNSKFDVFWKKARAKGLKVEAISQANSQKYKNWGLDENELKGLVLFNTKGKCSECHVLTPGPNNKPPLFTDFGYDNIGVPKNPKNPFYSVDKKWNPDGVNWVDPGLGGFLKGTTQYAQYAERNMGKHKVPTLRNVAVMPAEDFVKVYTHNGFFKSLKEIVHFYNARDVGDFPPAEVSANMNNTQMGSLGLTDDEENAIVAFLKTLSDGFVPKER
jgi:cytochrome c peroxidase